MTGEAGQWDEFYEDRSKACPFFVDSPDENLAEWFGDGLLRPGRVLELGCGPGRNATYLASLGCAVDAVDISSRAVAWARERAERQGVEVAFQCRSIFDAELPPASYDLVYDAGCFHQLWPHQRGDYTALVSTALKPGGSFGLVCFRPEGGSGFTDEQVAERASLGGGLGYTEDRLRDMFGQPPFTLRVLRQMRKTTAAEQHFGEDFLWALLATKQAGP